MDTGIALRTVSNVAATDYARTTSTPVQQAVQTELAPAKSVTAAVPSDQARNGLLPGRDAFLSQQYVIDPQTREVIFRVMDTRTRQVVRQVPDQALLRMRAYAKAVAEGKNPGTELMMDTEA
ncbi:flagellar protein FlaG [Xanthobacteraceae bacterium Astr-EGSB]|uniref:flagellar protein FlaG n=1 Tax=Astrobacterium formosum TaxID=3069710 RepID=UPI0027B7B04C|nr:flagellar protein FlaG [Xanthobacteraceae bacterium Astr-EGSB]